MKKESRKADPVLERAVMNQIYQMVIFMDPRLANRQYRMSMSNEEKNNLLREMFEIRDSLVPEQI